MTTSTPILVVKILSACSATATICSPAILISRIYNEKAVGVSSVISLATLLANCHTWMLYGCIIKNWFPLFWIFLFGNGAALVFLAVYWTYSNQRRYVTCVLAVTCTILVVLSVYALIGGFGCVWQTRSGVGSVMSIMADLSAVFQYGAPMEKLFHVLRFKSAVFINAHMVMASLVNNWMWFTCRILTDNWYFISPKILFISLNTFTLVLYAAFNPKTHPLPDDFYVPGRNENASISTELTPYDIKSNNTLFTSMQSPMA
ncbi:unnamed protein product [Phytophthora lilii]|uniref:Unnamed protein product n=1 Tax=Phytophthora lilii TaxID=2077276 RepID=A0A9W6TG07_9STRA|nr:unnamed protein product [Phytophthora lilii]